MKARLLHIDRDLAPRTSIPIYEGAVIADLELETLLSTMARGDATVAEVGCEQLLSSLTDVAAILYRQSALRDCIENAPAVRELYALAGETLEAKRRAFLLGMVGKTAGSVLFRAVELLEMLEERLQRLRRFVDRNAPGFVSPAFTALFAMLRTELGDDYLALIRDHLRRLRFPEGVLLSARLGEGNKGKDYVLRRGRAAEGWLRRTLSGRASESYSFKIADQDEGGARALAALKDRGIALVADASAQSTDHVLSFFKTLQNELAFYVGCLNLHEALTSLKQPTCMPRPFPPEDERRSAVGLYDVSLALTLGKSVVGNDLQADGKRLTVITGANRGGKSTFLRSLGLAQLMMQCGMFVAAERFEVSVSECLFTHYKREEDPSMQSGKLDEELRRMSAIVDAVVPDSLVLLNESFAATDEREGAEIARQVVAALVERGVIVYFVTHQYDFAQTMMSTGGENVLMLVAERRDDGARTFKIKPGTALATSYGKDLYDRIFGATAPRVDRG
jgi:DNA mismatch repair ATPase MutS